MIRTAFVILTLSLFASCEKQTFNCTYIITPNFQQADTLAIVPDTSAIAYGFYADTLDWMVADYADAIEGIITSRIGAGVRRFDFKAGQDSLGLLSLGPIAGTPMMFIVCDTLNRLYAWRQADIAPDLAKLQVSVTFKPWKKVSPYVESKWTMVNEFLSENPDPDPDPEEDPDQGEDDDPDDNPEPDAE